jgi:hypothetical protein
VVERVGVGVNGEPVRGVDDDRVIGDDWREVT